MGPDPLVTDHRLTSLERRADAHSESLRRGNEAFMELRQTVALMGRDVAEIRDIALQERQDRVAAIASERKEREERDEAWERRVTRVTGWTATLAGTILAGSVGTILTFILTRS